MNIHYNNMFGVFSLRTDTHTYVRIYTHKYFLYTHMYMYMYMYVDELTPETLRGYMEPSGGSERRSCSGSGVPGSAVSMIFVSGTVMWHPAIMKGRAITTPVWASRVANILVPCS